ncbi:rRNA adenine N-6-methyltransferase family protein [Blastococcus sp. Marseille-P5729]|uniref:rRNA adenine N-6-methyltransferase family protein n=1 Tax=Blastococcus sp. Marseille-P5729 TaxID=2086582 RepID=UPI00351A17F5
MIVGNIPFHLTTPLLRRLLNTRTWSGAILLTQWEVARKHAAVGGSTLMTAQSAPWFSFHLHARLPSRGFTPRPSASSVASSRDAAEPWTGSCPSKGKRLSGSRTASPDRSMRQGSSCNSSNTRGRSTARTGSSITRPRRYRCRRIWSPPRG